MNAENKHAPGPWEVSPDAVPDDVYQVGIYAEGWHGRIATVKSNEADAHLIAAAPELLEALESLAAVVGLTPVAGNKQALQEAFDLARAAIHKAKA